MGRHGIPLDTSLARTVSTNLAGLWRSDRDGEDPTAGAWLPASQVSQHGRAGAPVAAARLEARGMAGNGGLSLPTQREAGASAPGIPARWWGLDPSEPEEEISWGRHG